MTRLPVPNTRRHQFVGDITTIWLCTDNQFADRKKHRVGRVGLSGRMLDLADSYDMRLEKMLHYYLTWVSSDPIYFFGKNLIFFCKFHKLKKT